MVQIARLDHAFLEGFLIASKPSRRSITAAERKGEKGKAKKNSKTREALRHRSLSRPKTQNLMS